MLVFHTENIQLQTQYFKFATLERFNYFIIRDGSLKDICSLFTNNIKQIWEKITCGRKLLLKNKFHFSLHEILTVLVVALNYNNDVKMYL